LAYINTSIIFSFMPAIPAPDLTRLSEQLRAVADPTRLRILQLLPPTRDCEPVYNVSGLAEELGVPQPTVSHHLKALYNAGLVKCDKMCRDVYYWIDREALDGAMCAVKRLARVGEPG
jgi:ArsR family transcriptional regulator, arsenate/arsenite/antimonite-responsive transcriptional repressor